MDARILAYYPSVNAVKTTQIFGYSTKGIPGLEIIGLGKHGKNIKEKFIYLTRKERMKIPLKRYVVCVEGETDEIDHILSNNRWLELPMLILYWSMAELIPIRKLEDCLCSGKIEVTGKVVSAAFTDRLLGPDTFECGYKLIAPAGMSLSREFPLIPIEEIFSGFKCIKS